MNIAQIAGIGVVGTLLALQFKSGRSEYGTYLGIAVSLLLLFGMSGKLGVITETLDVIGSFAKVDDTYMKAILKMLGVTYVAEFASGICKDAGYQTIASQIEIFAKLTILALSMPVLEALLFTIRDFLK
ncbi:MAG: stage III sporulation AC/AD family protein [Bariatricus sp.]|nr:stage III sporulation AC/AD family protein [Bariatricus sp.]